jgi:hypothetical protein
MGKASCAITVPRPDGNTSARRAERTAEPRPCHALNAGRLIRAKPGELRWFAIVDGKEVEREDARPFLWKNEIIQPKSRTFLPAFVQDNPYLMATGYVTTLQGLPEPMRSQLLFGDFTVGREDDAWQVIPTAWVEAAMNRWTPDGKQSRTLNFVQSS